ncbi:MAG: hypothetical protein C0504_13375 [Candidatus Solibacter sp.]|nr:hypothetical protein [Candidatus Solibacter sp.]
MKHLCLCVLALLGIAAAGCARGDLAPQAITGVTLIDGTPNPPLSPANIVVERGRVVAAGPRESVPIPKDAEKIDGRGLFVFPLDPNQPIRVGADANLLLLNVNPALEQNYLKYVSGRMEIGRWTQYPAHAQSQ